MPRASPSRWRPRCTRFDLIERLAAHVADTLLARLPLERATVTVHKPEAPLGLEFDDVTVTVSRVRVPSVALLIGVLVPECGRQTERFPIGGIDRHTTMG